VGSDDTLRLRRQFWRRVMAFNWRIKRGGRLLSAAPLGMRLLLCATDAAYGLVGCLSSQDSSMS